MSLKGSADSTYLVERASRNWPTKLHREKDATIRGRAVAPASACLRARVCSVTHGLTGLSDIRAGRVMAKFSFPAQLRTVTGKQVRQLRRDGLVPGVVY